MNWRGNYIKTDRIRRLTPTECERLQGFPDGWTEGISDTQRYKCLGNAVTVNVIEAIMERLMGFLFLFFFLLTVNVYAGEFTNSEIANAIYKTEDSKRYPYGSKRYCPPNSKNWARLVNYFLNKEVK